ncbi:unnamed protein product, partial [Mesorhabditis belari]|uniref:3-hydroxyanthranilate 3,4-dioxygenase n=1 Tax=Mesorhabditis belari TaxID=2138241 RepID=A0AAF3ELL5_9BILA
MIVNEIDAWIEENKKDFVAPVCNKCMFANQLKVFFVGGPNQRLDYHLEEGEEVFYQRKGGMTLKVVEHGKRKDLVINEGEIFLLPSRVEHSPQRFEGTIGFVVERTRRNTEFEAIRYFIYETTERLFERWIHLTDVVKDLPPVIKEFKESDECQTGQPGANSFRINAPFEPRSTDLGSPIKLEQFLKENEEKLRKEPVQLYGKPKFKTEVIIFGPNGVHEWMTKEKDEVLLWLKDGFMRLKWKDEWKEIDGNAMIRVDPGETISFQIVTGHLILISMPTYS